MFTNCHFLDIFDYICRRNAQCWVRITKSNGKDTSTEHGDNGHKCKRRGLYLYYGYAESQGW